VWTGHVSARDERRERGCASGLGNDSHHFPEHSLSFPDGVIRYQHGLGCKLLNDRKYRFAHATWRKRISGDAASFCVNRMASLVTTLTDCGGGAGNGTGGNGGGSSLTVAVPVTAAFCSETKTVGTVNVTVPSSFGCWKKWALLGLVHFLFHRSTVQIEPRCFLPDPFRSEAARGHGVGRALVEAVYERARLAGCARVYWRTHENNLTVMKIHDKVAEGSGFVVCRKQL